MLVVVSPAKALNFEEPDPGIAWTKPLMMAQTRELMKTTRTLSAVDLAGLMGLSEKLADLNRDRYRAFRLEHTPENAKQAVLAFAGDTYRGLDATSLSPEDLDHAQTHLRIISGLYGVLRPLDLIQPYRLEMGTRLTTPRGHSLYDFWGDRIARALNRDLKQLDSRVVLNAASKEYFNAIPSDRLKASVVTPVFKEMRNGVARTLGFTAKVSRGMMARYVIRNRIDSVEDLKSFDADGYRFDPDSSSPSTFVFIRQPRSH